MCNLELPNVTLLSATSIKLPETIKALAISCTGIKFGRVLLLTSEKIAANDSFEVARVPAMRSTEDYSKLLINDLHRYVETPYVLIVQWDGFVLNPHAWDDEFYRYDYIGSPWPKGFHVGDAWNHPTGGPYRVGNGGFSFRSRECLKACSQLAAEGRYTRFDPEDMATCIDMALPLAERGIKIAPVEVAARFSFENWYNGSRKWNGQFGFHGYKLTDISRWTRANPQWKIENQFRSPRPFLLPWKKNFWAQFEKREYLVRQISDWIR
jgi:hypothetical protein